MTITKDILNRKLVSALHDIFPKNKDIADFLTDLLDLSKESVHRRLRGEVTFSFDEVVKISHKLELSIDKLINHNSSTVFFSMQMCKPPKTEDIYIDVLNSNIQSRDRARKAKNAEIFTVLNRVPFDLTLYHEYLCKFSYYKWVVSRSNAGMKVDFENFVMPEVIKAKQQEYLDARSLEGAKLNLIIDENIFLYKIREINYFRKRGLIKDSDIPHLQKDLHSVVEHLQHLTRTGISKGGFDIRIYLSAIDIEPSYSYSECDGICSLVFWSPAGEVVTTNNHEMCARQKEWIDSLVRYTTLITQCNEIQQLEFFQKQYKYINEMSENTCNKYLAHQTPCF